VSSESILRTQGLSGRELSLAAGGLERRDQLALTETAFYVTFFEAVPRVANGQASVTLDVTLPANAVVRRFDVRVGALQASQVLAANVAEVRLQTVDGAPQAVVDFGLLRTVSRVGLLQPADARVAPGIREIAAWNGTGFGPQAVWTAEPRDNVSSHVSFSEVKTERLRIELSGNLPESDLSALLYVVLPQPPADLELTLDGGAPVWTHPGPVRPGAGGELTAGVWNAEGQQRVPLAAALGALTGDPTAEGDRTFRLALAARVPGVLGLAEEARRILRVSRAPVAAGASGASGDVDFPTEGRQALPLTLPAAGRLRIEEVRFTVRGTPGPERVVEPVGPPVSPRAELAADPDHAFAVRLAETTGLAELTGLRLPLAAAPGGAEARLVLWREEEGLARPGEPLPRGVSEPVTLEPPPAALTSDPPWVTFPFAEPVDLEDAGALWAALTVSRGTVTWGLVETSGDTDPFARHEVRRGPPAGPWQRLPALFDSGGALGSLRGRVRAVGRAAKETPLAPLTAGLEVRRGAAVAETAAAGAPSPGAASPDAAVEITPTEDGVRGTLTLPDPVEADPGAGDTVSLVLTSRAVGPLTVEEIDVVWEELTSGAAAPAGSGARREQ
jgi:hypothetical protein